MRRLALGASGLALLLAGCAAPSTDPAPTLRVDPAHVAQREAAGIPDCPETPAEATTVADGLPELTRRQVLPPTDRSLARAFPRPSGRPVAPPAR